MKTSILNIRNWRSQKDGNVSLYTNWQDSYSKNAHLTWSSQLIQCNSHQNVNSILFANSYWITKVKTLLKNKRTCGGNHRPWPKAALQNNMDKQLHRIGIERGRYIRKIKSIIQNWTETPMDTWPLTKEPKPSSEENENIFNKWFASKPWKETSTICLRFESLMYSLVCWCFNHDIDIICALMLTWLKKLQWSFRLPFLHCLKFNHKGVGFWPLKCTPTNESPFKQIKFRTALFVCDKLKSHATIIKEEIWNWIQNIMYASNTTNTKDKLSQPSLTSYVLYSLAYIKDLHSPRHLILEYNLNPR